MVKTDTQPPKKTGIRKTAKNIVDKYPGIHTTIVEQPDKSLLGYVNIYGYKIPFSETLIDEMEEVLAAFERLPKVMMFGDKLGEFKREDVLRTALKGARIRCLEKEFIKALCMNKQGADMEYVVNMMLLIGFIPGQV